MKGFWNNKKVLVVGGAGFIGSHTVDALVARGARAAIVDNLSRGKQENCNPKARLCKIDAASASGLAKVFQELGPEFVILFPAVVDVPLAIKKPSLAVNSIAATINILGNSVRFGVKKILYASSGYIYGNTKKRPTPETEPFQPLNPYNISKATCESFLKFFYRHYGLSFVALRYAPTYGPRRTSGPIFDYIRKISRNQRAEIYGTKTRDYIFVSDVVRANLLALEKKTAINDPVFNIGTGHETRLDEIYLQIAKLVGRPANRPILRPGKQSEVERFALDVRKAKRVLGFVPRVSLEEGLRETVNWFLERNHTTVAKWRR